MGFKIAAFADEASSSLDGQIKAMQANGVGLLEIRGVDGENIADISAEKARDVRKRLDDAGIGVWSLGSPFGKIGMSDDFEPHLDKFRRSLETAHILGASHIRLFSFYGAEGIDSVLERLRRFIAAAEGSGIVLCHENEKGIYGDMASKCLEIHKALPRLRAIFDPANFIQCGQETRAAWQMLAPFVEYMHIKDAMPDGSVVPAGQGAGELPYLVSQYKGEVLTVEPHLSVFAGFDKLEAGKKSAVGRFVYPDSLAAFSAAVGALESIIGGAKE
ncbi:MAG: TIM barrel protein [Eubacteriales bacterium]|nr:TIM barrel protein [Eubacteriales bacterium]MDD3883175.1 TIM barrel protein [Eubacteriales bacterium]MDD4512442.1 TIM barrel protein [Eubacteriales bacterium]